MWGIARVCARASVAVPPLPHAQHISARQNVTLPLENLYHIEQGQIPEEYFESFLFCIIFILIQFILKHPHHHFPIS